MKIYGTTNLIGISEICRYCGNVFTYDRTVAATGTAYCGDECRSLARTQRSRLRQRLVSAPYIDWRQIADRDNWKCGICGELVTLDSKPREPSYPSVDHIIPLAQDGEHTESNVQLAHTGCNARKRDRLQTVLLDE